MAEYSTVPALLEHLRRDGSTSPRLIWYGPNGERVELSGRVLDNWTAKTANLLVDELDAEAGTDILLDLPAHWRLLTWALAAWQAGATVRLEPGPDAGTDVIVTNDPDRYRTGVQGQLVAVALGALSMRWPEELADGVLDYAAEIRAHADVYVGLPSSAGPDTALISGTARISYADLLGEFSSTPAREADAIGIEGPSAAGAEGGAVLVSAALPKLDVLQIALGTWAGGSAVVLVHPDVPVTDRLLQGERITRRFGPDLDR